ncbi:MAG: ribonuclease HII [Candidatus Nealsonbacteria bacterium]
MKKLNLREEGRIWKVGYKKVVGLDEAGRGCLAGPVVAAATMIRNQKIKIDFPKMADSKKMSPKGREDVFKLLTTNTNIKWGIGRVSEKVIDKINILEATKLAMKKAVKNMKVRPNFLILDGNFKINSKLPQKSIIGGDGKVFSCMAAGIIAKVTRDRIMEKFHKEFPLYGFDKHKGYPTKYHRKIVKKYGLSKIHRKTFKIS